MPYRWTCHQTGDCCRQAGAVVMTLAESAALREAAPDRDLRFDAFGDGRRVVLMPVAGTRQCPLLGADGRCSVYAARPYNCRRFACLRTSPDEPLTIGGPMGSLNTEATVRGSVQAARWYARNQRAAQWWGRRHGWTEDMT